jgi:MoaA/NifB/PqqE/SkfB family radical SAM enzyme
MTDGANQVDSPYGPPRLTVELANVCNLHCAYCLRDEDALYHDSPRFLDLDLMRRLFRDSAEIAGIREVCFTGGEPTLHPNFKEALAACATFGLKVAFITNGWNFGDICNGLEQYRATLSHIAFSIDGTTQQAHDRWRGKGSFERLIRAFSYCQRYNLPFVIKTGIRRDTLEHLEDIALFAARLGAEGLAFAHLLPTSLAIENNLALTLAERRRAEEEITILRRIFKMKITIDVGYYNIDPAAPCAALAGKGLNVDYLGRLTLCCNLSGFRGAIDDSDLIADLNQVAFADAYGRFQEMAKAQLDLRTRTLSAMHEDGVTPDLQTGSPCLFCLQTFRKSPWQKSVPAALVSISRT